MQCTVKIHQTNGIGATYSLYPNYFITDFSKISPKPFNQNPWIVNFFIAPLHRLVIKPLENLHCIQYHWYK